MTASSRKSQQSDLCMQKQKWGTSSSSMASYIHEKWQQKNDKLAGVVVRQRTERAAL